MRKKSLYLGLFLALALVITQLPLSAIPALAATGLSNFGFEEGILNGKPNSWNVSAVDSAIVVAAEGSSKFPAYADMGVTTVQPYRGNYMLRIGTPKKISEKQESGYNTVSQTFTPDGNTIRFAFRLFSWENRGDDQVTIALTDAGKNPVGAMRAPGTNTPVTIKMSTIATTNTTISLNTPLSINVGKRGNILNTGWVEAEIYNIPTNKGPLTLSYSVSGLQNSAHATWGYFDNVNRPPVANFGYSPLSPWEGDFIEFIDKSTDPDEPGDRIVAWEWNIVWDVSDNGTDADDPISGSDLRNPFFIPVDEGKYIVTLKVTDTYGATGQKTQMLTVDNAPPAVNANSIEVLAGQDAKLFGRFIDPGWRDTHPTAVWSFQQFGVTASAVSIQENNYAFMGAGVVTGTANTSALSAGTVIDGLLQVQDDSGASSSNAFTIKIVNEIQIQRESNNNISEATLLKSDNTYLSFIGSQGDTDVYEIVDGQGNPLTIGAEALVTLQNLPNDYDMVILSQRPAGFQQGGFQMGGFQMGGFQMGGFQMGGFQMGGFQMGGFQMGGFQMGAYQMGAFQMGGYQMGGFQMGGFQMGAYQMGGFQMGAYQMGGFQMGAYQMGGFQMGGYQMGGYQMGGFQMGDGSADYPLSQIVSAGTQSSANDNIGGTDISLAELGLSLEELAAGIEGTVEVVGFSANRGLNDETLLASVDTAGTRLFVVIVGANDAFSYAPYSLRIETSRPLDLLQLFPDAFDYPAPVSDWSTSTETAVIHTSASPRTLFVTQQERIIGRYGEAAWLTLKDAFVTLSGNSAIAGDIISIPISIYQQWDSDYSSIDAANNVVAQIRQIVNSYILAHPTIEYVVILGNDDNIPFHRDPDMTTIGNERQYAMTSFIRPGSPLFYSLLGGYILTDDYLVDDLPILWQGRPSYVPDRPVARIVETPEEMAAAAQAFIASSGILSLETALVSYYDAFDDGAQAVVETLKNPGGITGDNLKTLTPEPALWNSNDLYNALMMGYDINNINAHYTHFTALAAAGFAVNDFTDVLTSTQVRGIGLNGALYFTMGCHAGLNVPDIAAPDSSTLGLNINPQLDFPQAMNRAILVGSTGFGYFDDAGIGGTEDLMGRFTRELFSGSVTVGEALVKAKQQYRLSISNWTVYDDKSSIQFALYGLPQYLVGGGAVASSFTALASPTVQPLTSGSALILNGYALTLHSTPSGNYYAANGDYQATPFRPIQPRLVIPLANDAAGPVHGAILTSGNYTKIEGFDPVITRPTIEWELAPEEIQLLPPTFWPSQLATVNTLETGGGVTQTLVVLPAQFKPTGIGQNSQIIGTELLYDNLQLVPMRSDSADYVPPVISGIDLEGAPNGSVNVTINASDASGIAQVVILKIADGGISQIGSSSGSLVVNIPNPGNNSIIIQVVDGAGNVAVATGKGASLSVIPVNAGPDLGYTVGRPVNFKAVIPNYNGLTQPVFFTWKFGDGTPDMTGIVNATVDSNGNGVFVVPHTYNTFSESHQYTASLKITDSNGGTGKDTVIVSHIWDKLGDAVAPNGDLVVGGYITNDANSITVSVPLAAPIVSGADRQYRVKIFSLTDGSTLAHVRYDSKLSKSTGLPSLQVTIGPDGKQLLYTFSLSDIGRTKGDHIGWAAETQDGVASTSEVGKLDNMPDSGLYGYLIWW